MQSECFTCFRYSENRWNLSEKSLYDRLRVLLQIEIDPACRSIRKVCNECYRNVCTFYDFRNIVIKISRMQREGMQCCRTCLKPGGRSSNIFQDSFPHKIKLLSGIEIREDDRLSDKICPRCESLVKGFWNLRTLVLSRKMDVIKREVNDDEVIDIEEIRQKDVVKPAKKNTGVRVNVKKPNPLYQCELCNYKTPIFQSLQSWKVHMMCHKEDEGKNIDGIKEMVFGEKEKPGVKNETPIHMYYCKLCTYETHLFKSWRSHMRSHDGNFTLCEICGKLITNGYMAFHSLSHFENTFTCTVCGTKLRNQKTLSKHVESHQKGLHVPCDICKKFFANKRTLLRHKLRHEGNLSRKSECNICKKKFYYPGSLRRHKRTHTGERPYPCLLCKKHFSSPYALKTHTRNHTNERPYSCGYCNMAFTVKVSLQTHIKSKHSGKVLHENNTP